MFIADLLSGGGQYFELSALGGGGQPEIVADHPAKVFADSEGRGHVNGVESPERRGVERRRCRQDASVNLHQADPRENLTGPAPFGGPEAASAQGAGDLGQRERARYPIGPPARSSSLSAADSGSVTMSFTSAEESR